MAAGAGGGFGYASSDTNKTDCLGRIPYATLIALALSISGVAVFCTLSYRAVNTSLHQMQAIFKAEVAWLDKVQLTFILVGVLMGVVALILLIVGALATGATRTQVYSGWKARLGGRISCAAFLILTYLLYLCWLALFTFTTVLAFLYFLFNRVCDSNQIRALAQHTNSARVCVDFGILSPFLNSSLAGASTNGAQQQQLSYEICDSDLLNFCAYSDTAKSGYYVAYFACVIVLLGLIHFMICLASNYVHIKDGFKYFELEEIRNEENDMTHYGTRGTGNFRM